MMIEIAAWGIAWAAAIGMSALCSGMETGIYSLNRVRLDVRARRVPPDHSAVTIRAELEQPERILATLLIANNIVHYISAESMHGLLEPLGLSEAGQGVINALVIAPMLFIFGEAVPKELFRLEADRITYRFAYVLRLMRTILTWSGVLWMVRGVAGAAERAAGLTPASIVGARERIAFLLKEGAAHGAISESQATLVDRALALRGLRVSDEMTLWAKVRAVPADADRARAVRIVGDAAHARLPVIDRTGRVIGVVRQIDFHLQPGSSASDLMSAPVRLKRETPVPEALRLLRAGNTRLGIVEDDVGRPVGIVTTKDLVEPLTGTLEGI